MAHRNWVIIAMVILLLACGAALASDWVSIDKSDDGKTETLVDRSTIRIDGLTRKVWSKLVNAPHSTRGVSDAAHKWVAFSVARMVFNCQEETTKLDSLQIYYEDGTNESVSGEPGWRPVVPDTLMQREMQFVCAFKPE